MKILYLLVATFNVIFANPLEPGVSTVFGLGKESINIDHYYSIPENVTAAIAEGWTLTKRRPCAHLYDYLTMYCAPELTFCTFYDDTEYIAGSQIAMRKDHFTNNTLDWIIQGYQTWIVNDVEYWAMDQFYVNEEFLQKPISARIVQRNHSKVTQMESIWLTGFRGELYEIPDKVENLDPIWSRQACVTGMGVHYYYNLTNTECSSDLIFPWYVIYFNGELVSSLWAVFGSYPAEPTGRFWYENPKTNPDGSGIIKKSFPDMPKCHLEIARNTISRHHWTVKNPWDIVCPK